MPQWLDDDHVRAVLSEQFAAAMAKSKANGRSTIVLEIFCGTAHLSKALRSHGMGVVSLDTKLSDAHDISRKVVADLIIGWITGGAVACVWLGTPCDSWSRARHDIDKSGPRSQTHIMGKNDLSAKDRIRVCVGNMTMLFSVKLISIACKSKIPIIIENPATSFLWDAPAMRRVSSGHTDVIVDFCQFGKRWRKRTRLRAWNFSILSTCERKCCGRRGICSRTLLPHIQLRGKLGGQALTKIAEPYPTALCSLLAQTIRDGTDALALWHKSSRIW